MQLTIRTGNDPVLHLRAQHLPYPIEPRLAELVGDMLDTMYAAEGLGLAAPQVGHSLRIIVAGGG